MLFPDII